MSNFRIVNLNAKTEQQAIDKLKAALNGSAGAGMVVQSYSQGILQQPAFTIPTNLVSKLPPINKFMDKAKSNADFYLKSIQPKIIKTVTDVGGYSQEFNAFYTQANQQIQAWKMGSDDAKVEALQLLNQLDRDLKQRRDTVVLVEGDLANFLTSLNEDVSNFTTVVNTANTVIGGNQGAIAEMSNNISDLDKQIAGASAGVALSGLTIIGGALLIFVGAVVSSFAAGAGTPFIAGGIVVVVTGAAGLTASSVVLASLVKAKGKLITDKKQLEADLRFLHTFNSNVTLLQSSASTAATQVANMKNAWTILGNNMGNVIQSLDKAQTFSELPLAVQAYLSTANNQWSQVQGTVTNIEKQMTGVTTKTLKDSKGKLAQITEASVRAAA